MVLSPRAQAIFEKKSYGLKKGQSFEDRTRQIVYGICKDWKKKDRDEVVEMVVGKLFSFGGRIWHGWGRTGMIANCIVLPVADNMDETNNGILNIKHKYTKIESLGGGVGINFSPLRYRGAPIHRGRKDIEPTEFSCGPVGFMKTFNEEVRQITGGGERKGATMAILHWKHKDIEEFMKVKNDRTQLEMFNISVMFDDEFFKLLDAGNARVTYLWNLFCENAYEHGEPGWLHYDNLNRDNSIAYYSDIQATNPCGELPGPPYTSCLLSAINTYELPSMNDLYALEGTLREAVHYGVRFLTEANRQCKHPIKECEVVASKFRRIGLGVMGWAEYLIKNNLKYGEEESIKVADKFFELFRNYSYEASIKLAMDKNYGPFPGLNVSKFLQSSFIKRLPKKLQEDIKKHGIANSALNTVAPTGTTSQLFDVNFGIEPIYSNPVTREDRLGSETIYHPLSNHPKFVTQKVGVNTSEFFDMKVAAEEYIDGGISGTVGIPEHYTLDELKAILRKYVPLTKGGTVYREGSRVKEMLKGKEFRPYVTESKTYKFPVNNAKGDSASVFVTITYKEGKPFEVFCTNPPGERGAFIPSDAFSITVSTLLRAGVPPITLTNLFKEYVDLSHPNFPAILVKLLGEEKVKVCTVEEKEGGACKTCE